jgi:hypothetical protein
MNRHVLFLILLDIALSFGYAVTSIVVAVIDSAACDNDSDVVRTTLLVLHGSAGLTIALGAAVFLLVLSSAEHKVEEDQWGSLDRIDDKTVWVAEMIPKLSSGWFILYYIATLISLSVTSDCLDAYALVSAITAVALIIEWLGYPALQRYKQNVTEV